MNNYLDTILSLVFIFFIFSIIAYIFQELIAVNLEYRGRLLWKSIAQLLDGFRKESRELGKNKLKTGNAPNTDALFNHPQIYTLRKTPDSYPSYIPAANFALAVMDLVAKQAPADKKTGDLLANIRLGIEQHKASKPADKKQDNKNDTNQPDGKQEKADKEGVYTVLENLLATSRDVKELQEKIETWFNEYMQRVTGWYKSNTVVTVRIIAVAVTLFFNVNVIKLTREIFINAQLRRVLTAAAINTENNQALMDGYLSGARKTVLDSLDHAFSEQLAKAKNAADSSNLQRAHQEQSAEAVKQYGKKSLEGIDSLYQKINKAGIPLGWNGGVLNSIIIKDTAGHCVAGDTAINILWILLGWFIAAGCISMGAPFWFDILSKLVNVRRAGIVPGKV